MLRDSNPPPSTASAHHATEKTWTSNARFGGRCKLRGDLKGEGTLPANDVRAVGEALGFDDAGLLAAVTKLQEDGLVRIEWGGGVRVLEPKQEGDAGAAGPVFSSNFYGAVANIAGSGANVDLRGGEQRGRYVEGGGPKAKLEEIVAELAAAAADLRARVPSLDAEEAAQVRAVADEASEAAQEVQKEAPDKPGLNDRLKKLSAGVEEVGKIQTAAAKLGPTLGLLGTGGMALRAFLGV